MGMTRALPWSDDAECWWRRLRGLSSVASLSTGGMVALVLGYVDAQYVQRKKTQKKRNNDDGVCFGRGPFRVAALGRVVNACVLPTRVVVIGARNRVLM